MLKSAESPLLRAAINLLGTKALLDDQEDAKKALRIAAYEDMMSRQNEAQRMGPVRRGLRPAGGFAPDTTDYAGSLRDFEPGTSLALPFEKGSSADPELTKEALNLIGGAKLLTGKALQGGGIISKGVGRLAGAAGRGLEGVGGAVSKGLTPTGRFLNAGASEAQQFASAVKPGFGGVLQGAGRKLQNAGLGIGVAGQNVAAGGKVMAQGALAPAAQAATQAATQAVGQASKPLIGTGTRLKALGAAGVLGAGYLGYKGLQTGRDYMAQPAGQHQQDYLSQGVNQYGYNQ